MTSTYAILATVELLHEYYSDGRCPDFSLEPDVATAAIMRGAGVLSRTIGNVLVLLAKVDESGVLHRALPVDTALRFGMNLGQPLMLNYTNLELPENSCYLFSNRFETTVADELYLNRGIPAFSASTDYPIAALVTQGGKVFEAIRPVSQGDHVPGDAVYWQARGNTQYVHSGDLVRRADGRVQLSVAAASAFEIEVFALNPATGTVDVPTTAIPSQSFESPVSAINVDLRDLSTGLYRIHVNGADYSVFLDREGSRNRSLGVIELWTNLDPAGDFSLTDAAGKPKGKTFYLRFANRLAIWKYLLKTDAATGVSIQGQTAAFVAGTAPREFISAKPLPLAQAPVRNIQLMRGGDVLASRLANPPPERISRHSDAGSSWYCAEMQLNY